MEKNDKPRPITIDLNQFKLRIALKNRIELTLHFNSPSRKFYLSVIALVVNEMKKLGKITSVPLEGHHDLLVLLNETVGGSAGSSEKESLLPRIYKKWQHVLPNLEEAPLFTILGRQKGYEEGIGKTYPFSEAEKDSWANLFEYKGSHENVRLKFAVDRIGAGLEDVDIIYEDRLNGDAWERFITSLKQSEVRPKAVLPVTPLLETQAAMPRVPKKSVLKPLLHRNVVITASLAVVLGIASFMLWHAYALRRAGSLASMERIAFPLPNKPTIAVLPFVNMSGDPEQEYFSDGITEDIITNLAKLPTLVVLSRNSTFQYKGKQVKIAEVAKDLRVRHVLEGSVRRAGGRVRITVQLIDCRTGQHVWGDKYDRELKDIFSVQDEVTRKVASELAVVLTASESERLNRKHTNKFAAYDLYLKARREAQAVRKENALKGMELSRQVIDLDPNFAGGYQNLSHLLSRGVRLGWSASPREDLDKAYELAQKAISVDNKFSRAYMALASVYLNQGKHDEAVATANEAARIVPGDSETMLHLAFYLNWVGRGEDAVAAVKQSMDLDPMYLYGPNPTYLDFMGQACFTAGHYEESIASMKKAIERFGSAPSRDPFLIASCIMLGRIEEAKAAAQQWLKANPTFSRSSWQYGRLYKRSEDSERLYTALLKAGLK